MCFTATCWTWYRCFKWCSHSSISSTKGWRRIKVSYLESRKIWGDLISWFSVLKFRVIQFWNFGIFFIFSFPWKFLPLREDGDRVKLRKKNFFMYQVYSLVFITHGASGVRNFWHLSAKILYTVEPKTATSPCVHFEVAASPTEKKHHFSMYLFLATLRLWR